MTHQIRSALNPWRDRNFFLDSSPFIFTQSPGNDFRKANATPISILPPAPEHAHSKDKILILKIKNATHPGNSACETLACTLV